MDNPDRFATTVAEAPERSHFDCNGAAIELLTWGRAGETGALLVHGNGAHADWWRWTAPLLARDRRVAAISLSGMGRSDRRTHYSIEQFGDEIRAAMDAAGLGKPFVVGHSFGGVPAASCTARYPDAVAGLVLVDTFVIARPGPQFEREQMKVYATREEAITRFRLMPRQEAPAHIVRFIGEHSLMEATDAEGRQGWSWCFDPKIWGQLDIARFPEILSAVARPMACLFGEHSVLGDAEQRAAMRRLVPVAMQIEIPQAAHHIMADQPLALVAALRAIFAGWDS